MHLLDPLRVRLAEAIRSGEEVHFIYNHAFTLEGEELGDPEERLVRWALEKELPLERVRLVVKNFGWVSHRFRTGIERRIAVRILEQLVSSGLSGSHDIAPADLEKIVATSHDHFPGFWDCSPEAWEEMRTGAIAMPYRFEMIGNAGVPGMGEWLESLTTRHDQRIEIIGGYAERCLDEICMMLEASRIGYTLDPSLLYFLPLAPEDELDNEPLSEVRTTPLFLNFEEFEVMGV